MLQPRIKIVIVDDHPLIIEGLVKLLSKKQKFEIVGSFINGLDFLAFLKTSAIDIVLLDIMLPDINGMELCMEIKSIAPDTIVLALSNHEERGAILKMLENGANGYLLKNVSVDELLNCISEALDGRITFSEAVKEIMTRPQLSQSREQARLTVREKEILKLIASGTTTSRIAEILFLSKFTVENHRKNMLQKFKAKNVAELINLATQQGQL